MENNKEREMTQKEEEQKIKKTLERYIAGMDTFNDSSKAGVPIHIDLMDWEYLERQNTVPFPELVEELSKYYDKDDIPNYATNYKIVKDKDELQKFIDFLPELNRNEKFYYSLFARKKYGATEGLKADKCQLKRGTTTKERMYRDFKKLEVALGSYEIDGIPINQDSLVLYITPNPRNMRKAALEVLRTLATDVADEKELINPVAVAYNEVQVAGRKVFFDIDVDIVDGQITPLELKQHFLDAVNGGEIRINKDALNFVETHGGVHILVELDKIYTEYKKMWYYSFDQHESTLFDITMNGDNMIPVPGCVQSNSSPKLLL